MCVSKSRSFVPENRPADTEPKLQPALLRLSAMISQYFVGCLRSGLVLNDLLPVLRNDLARDKAKHNKN